MSSSTISGRNTIKPGPARAAGSKPIVFYGTSITHGIGASRAGMTHVAMLGRTFHREVINLGFSGNGRMDPEVVKFVAELDPAVFVLDCLPNMGAQLGACPSRWLPRCRYWARRCRGPRPDCARSGSRFAPASALGRATEAALRKVGAEVA